MNTDTRTIRTTITTRDTNDALYFGTQIIWILTALIEVVLLLRGVFNMISNDETTIFGRAIYAVSDILLIPFIGLFGTLSIGNTGIDGVVLIALVIYLAIGAGIVSLINDQIFSQKFDPSTRIKVID